MATLQEKLEAEHRFRSLVDDEGLPEPDHIEYGHTCIRVMWRESKLCVVIDIDDLGPDAETLEGLGFDPADLGADGAERRRAHDWIHSGDFSEIDDDDYI